MGTRIELHHVTKVDGVKQRTVEETVEIGDETGVYETHLGRIGYVRTGGAAYLDVTKTDYLGGRKGRRERTIVFMGNRGVQQIGNDREIFIRTNVDPSLEK